MTDVTIWDTVQSDHRIGERQAPMRSLKSSISPPSSFKDRSLLYSSVMEATHPDGHTSLSRSHQRTEVPALPTDMSRTRSRMAPRRLVSLPTAVVFVSLLEQQKALPGNS